MYMFLRCCVGVVFTLFLTVMPDYGLGMKVAMTETHCIFSVFRCMLTNVFLYCIFKNKNNCKTR